MKLPKWIRKTFKSLTCPHEKCGVKLTPKGVFGFGIRDDKNKIVFCFDYMCASCLQRTTFTGFPTTLEQFTSDIADLAGINLYENADEDDFPELSDEEMEKMSSEASESNNENENDESDEYLESITSKPKKRKPRSGISKAEMKEFHDYLKKSESHEDFLEKLGINIEEYKKDIEDNDENK